MSSFFLNIPGNGRHLTGVKRDLACTKKEGSAYALIGEYATPQEALAQCRIQGMPLGDILEDESAELLGQD